MEVVAEVASALSAAYNTPAPDGSGPMRLVHRDIKPSNVFVDRRNLCRLGDYGIASFASDAGSVRGVLGTPLYLAPELIEGRVCNEMADMWALGVTIMILLTGQPPMELAGWNRQRRLDPRYVMITAGDGGLERLITSWRMDAKMPPIVIDLVAALLQLNPSNRPSASQVLQHPFLTEAGLAQALAEAEAAQARYDAEAHK